ncbi:MAG TPA: prenyltransferase/squalene oxidase repeat-containing protein [Fimbriiglobus sp.]|nr:prenyltransferase/squalene oxidase repeat-containing protein [Fimbriiglobus sp.]
MKSLLTLATLAACAGPASAQPARGSADEAIDRGLAYLHNTQNRDGSWSVEWRGRFGAPGNPRGVGGSADLAVTALSVMAFLSAGHVPGEGPYRDTVDRGVRYVMTRQSRTGLFPAPLDSNTEMYYQGICTLMLAEVVGMVDGRLADDLRARLTAAVRVILEAQRKSGRDVGGWRYSVHGSDADLSVTGWQLLALRAAKNVGCDVPPDRIQAAVDYVRKCHDPRTGGYTYVVYGNVTTPCTGTGVLALALCGKDYHKSPDAVQAASYLLQTPLVPGRPHFYYGVYYVSQAMFQMGDALGTNYWTSYREELHRLLLRTAPPRADGAWGGRGLDDGRLGPAYCTAMAVLALTVEYRLLPIYQRFDEPRERDGIER